MLARVVLVGAFLGSAQGVLAAPPRDAKASLDCPIVVTVSQCPESEEDFCQAYNYYTPVTNCAWFGGAWCVYCGTPG